jgi:hypothetical protein
LLRLLREYFRTVVVALHDLDVGIGRGEGLGRLAEKHGDVVFWVSGHQGMQNRATDVACSAGAAEDKYNICKIGTVSDLQE